MRACKVSDDCGVHIRFRVPDGVSLAEFTCKTGPVTGSLRYTDMEGDVCCISNDLELHEVWTAQRGPLFHFRCNRLDPDKRLVEPLCAPTTPSAAPVMLAVSSAPAPVASVSPSVAISTTSSSFRDDFIESLLATARATARQTSLAASSESARLQQHICATTTSCEAHEASAVATSVAAARCFEATVASAALTRSDSVASSSARLASCTSDRVRDLSERISNEMRRGVSPAVTQQQPHCAVDFAAHAEQVLQNARENAEKIMLSM